MTEPLSSTKQIEAAIASDPKLAYDPNMIANYQKYGGTLSNNAIPSTTANAPKVSEVGLISTDQGTKALNNANASMARMTPPPAAPATSTTGSSTSTASKTDTTTPTAPKTTKITLLNPDTGQSVTFDDAIINKSNIQGYLSSGYRVSDASGSIPDWLNPASTATTNTPSADTTAQADLDRLKMEKEAAETKLKNFNVSNDPALQSIISGITSSWNSRITEMEQVNKNRIQGLNTTGIRTGSRYTGGAGGVFGSIISEEERQAVDRITDLEGKKNSAIAEAKAAYESKMWGRYADLVKIAEGDYKDQLTAVQKLNEAAAEKSKQLAAEAKDKREADTKIKETLTKNITDVLTSARKNGAPSDVVQSIQDVLDKGGDLADAVSAAGDYGTEASGTLGEYYQYKREALAKGVHPMDWKAYKNWDDNNKATIANAAGLTIAAQNTALKLADDYEQRSKDFYLTRDAYNRVVASAADPSAAGDVALVFNYMKVLDPGSTVREGEFATAQNAGSAFDKAGSLYNQVMSGKRLTEDQRKDFVSRTGKLFDGAKKQQETTVKEFTDRAKQYGVPASLVVRGTDASSILVEQEKAAEVKLKAYTEQNPEKKQEIADLISSMEKTLGRSVNASEFYERYPNYK